MSILNTTDPTNTNIHLVFAVYVTLTGLLIVYKKKHIELIQLLLRPEWTISFIIIVLWSVYILKYDMFGYLNKDPDALKGFRAATSHGIIAFVIALFAYIDLTIPTFWFIWFISYYIDKDEKFGVV
jgi:hypothetical protein